MVKQPNVVILCISITCLYTVVKAERVSNDSVNKDYVFPDEDDNLTSYTGGSAQLTISSGLLQNISKHTISFHKELHL